MKTRLFYTTGNRDIIETTWDKPEPNDDQIEVQAIMTGVCRSDIDMYDGKFTTLPKEIQGHEGLGRVTKIGANVAGRRCGLLEVGNIVATRGEPAFSDFYNVDKDSFVVIEPYYQEHAIDPKYIIEPVACGVNLVAETLGLKRDVATSLGFLQLAANDGTTRAYVDTQQTQRNILILGTGFLATVVYNTLKKNHKGLEITVMGKANQSYWIEQSVRLVSGFNEINDDEYFDVIYDISDKVGYVKPEVRHLKEGGTLVVASEKKPNVAYPVSDLLWKSAKVLYPSPRSQNFYNSMQEAVDMISYGDFKPESLWTQEYDRDTEVKQAFEDGLNRKRGYSRGYIKW